jgi:FkbM family methyltransferase
VRNLRRALRRGRRDGGAVDLFRQFVGAGELVFDVGANVGDRVASFLALGARVVAIEPQPECADQLRARFGGAIEVIRAAAGPELGEADLLVGSYHTISSLSSEWVEEVRASGRFAEFEWNERLRVPVVTLASLIERFGTPAFCKIDVEGYELGVIQGLDRSVPALSFEFTFELLESRIACIQRLADLGMVLFNFSEGESMRLAHRRWLGPDAIVEYLRSTPRSPSFFGDVYART